MQVDTRLSGYRLLVRSPSGNFQACESLKVGISKWETSNQDNIAHFKQ